MQTTAYVGYFDNGRFYSSGQIVKIPEQRRVIITVLDEPSVLNADKMEAWNDFKGMIAETAYENHLLQDYAFTRNTIDRGHLVFESEADE
ncbi:MAG: hypothetical protein LBR85_07735 [Oscillospiraceae bacterium]|nr:hypothetical protein [Oscillospiraceae bacterium]